MSLLKIGKPCPEVSLTYDVVPEARKEAILNCNATGGYPPIRNMSLVKSGQVSSTESPLKSLTLQLANIQ